MVKKQHLLILGLAVCLALGLGGVHTGQAFQVGNLKVGGAIRANYVSGDYTADGTGNPQRGDNGGNFELDTFRVNLDYAKDQWLGKVEYRFYDGYNFLHTGWVGYQFDPDSQLQVGVNRIPFGVGPYGPANNFFFDMNYYVGLSDDMDLGAKYTTRLADLKLDVAYYYGPEPKGLGDSIDSTRYSYDIVDENTPYASYEEKHQFNARAIYLILADRLPTDVGVSLQYGLLEADSRYADDSSAFAGAVHTNTTWGPWNLKLQYTAYKYDAKYRAGLGMTNGLIGMGAWNYNATVASQGAIPSIALAYTWQAVPLIFIDSITFYNDYSILLKDGNDAGGAELKDSAMNVTGMAIAHGGWYIYVDYALSDGNFFIGDKGDFGANAQNEWQHRFNINFGYYF